MSEDPTPDHDLQADSEFVTLGGAQQMAFDLLQLIEAKALAQRLAFKALVQELSAAAGPETAFRIQAQLDALRWDPEMVRNDDNALRDLVAQELSSLISMLDDLVTAPDLKRRRS